MITCTRYHDFPPGQSTEKNHLSFCLFGALLLRQSLKIEQTLKSFSDPSSLGKTAFFHAIHLLKYLPSLFLTRALFSLGEH